MALTRAEIQRNYRQRRAEGVELRKRRLVNDEGRECAYSGPGNCGHQFRPWHEFGPGSGPHGKERRCKPCMVAKMADYLKHEPTAAQERRNNRQKDYQKTEAGKDVNRRARLKYRYGITGEQYDWLAEQQDWLCYFCGFEETVIHHATKEVMLLGVDHAHGCDQGHDPAKGCPVCVRGLACYNCNIFIARAERSPVLRTRVLDLLARRPLRPELGSLEQDPVAIRLGLVLPRAGLGT
jgi:hypothetical protein